jgi:hypothetical protein
MPHRPQIIGVDLEHDAVQASILGFGEDPANPGRQGDHEGRGNPNLPMPSPSLSDRSSLSFSGNPGSTDEPVFDHSAWIRAFG